MEWITVAASITGMVTGAAGLTLSLVNFFKERARLYMEVQPNMKVMNAPPYDPEKTYVCITVTNIGRRPLYLNMVAMLTPDGRNGLINDGFRNPRKVGEGDPPSQYMLDQNELLGSREHWPGLCFVVRAADGTQAYRFLSTRPKSYPEVARWWLLRLRTRWHFRWAFKRVNR